MTRERSRRRTARRIRRHAALALASAAAVLVFDAALAGERVVFRLSMGTAYTALALFVVTLALGPLNVLRGRPNPVSTDVRRDVAIWAGGVGLAHVVVGLQAHLGGDVVRYFLYPPGEARLVPIRYDPFGAANHAGLLAAALIALLLAISNDAALRRLGTRRWKRVQRWSYACFALVVMHGFLYQWIEGRERAFIAGLGLAAAAAAGLQAAGFARRRSRRRGAGTREITADNPARSA